MKKILINSDNFEHKVGDILPIYDSKIHFDFFYLREKKYVETDALYFTYVYFCRNLINIVNDNVKIKIIKNNNEIYNFSKFKYTFYEEDLPKFKHKTNDHCPIKKSFVYRLNTFEQSCFEKYIELYGRIVS